MKEMAEQGAWNQRSCGQASVGWLGHDAGKPLHMSPGFMQSPLLPGRVTEFNNLSEAYSLPMRKLKTQN